MSEHLHIVCLDAPSPPNYGGAIDMFYKIKALSAIGKKIILHYFAYNPLRGATDLEENCSMIYTYSRKSLLNALPLSQPFIIQSRENAELIKNLNKDAYPILLEGLHCSGIVPGLNNQDRVIIRMHNEEASYYYHLAKSEKWFLKKQYFLQESRLLRSYQQQFNKKVTIACLSESDIEVLKNDYGYESTFFIPCFIPWQKILIKEGKGDYCLYHGNMSVSENEEAALWLISKVFNDIDTAFVIAGNGISKRLANEVRQHDNVSVINNPTIGQLDELIQDAQINVLPSMNSTGVKLKLLNALINGRHCITNFNGVKGSRISNGLSIQNNPIEWKNEITKLFSQSFSNREKQEREAILALYNNIENAEKLNALW